MVLVASESSHVYTFATPKFKPILNSEPGRKLIKTCLTSDDSGIQNEEIKYVEDSDESDNDPDNLEVQNIFQQNQHYSYKI
jgi:hypothetical protein